jgi:hypothetical protein
MSEQNVEPDGETCRVGLCTTCHYVQRIESARASRFYLCKRSRADARYPRYPRLPVLTCAGYEPDEDHPS